MNKLDSFKGHHLELKNVSRTYFHSEDDKKHTVLDAPANIFDAWIAQFVETIENVDRASWDIFQRWNIINAVLAEGLLCVVGLSDGDHLERMNVIPLEAKPEEKASGLASENDDIESHKPATGDTSHDQ